MSTNASMSTVETPEELLRDRLDLMGATTVSGVAYGITLSLYATCASFLIKNLKLTRSKPSLDVGFDVQNRRRWIFYLAYASVLTVLATLYTAASSQGAVTAYVDNRLFPGGPYEYDIEFMWKQPMMIMVEVTYFLIFWFTDAIILWRFIMFYRTLRWAKWIIPFPCAMYVGVVVLTCVVLQQEAVSDRPFNSLPGLPIAYYGLSLSLNILSTIMISIRLYIHKRELERVLGTGSETPYMSIATMLIESAALYGIWSLVFLILYALGNAGQVIVLTSMAYIQVISPLLIILSIARGTAWNMRTQAALSSIKFASQPVAGPKIQNEYGIARARERTTHDIELGFMNYDHATGSLLIME